MDSPARSGTEFSSRNVLHRRIAYNRAATGRDITKVDDLWDPEFKGKVSLFTTPRTALGHDHAGAGQLAGRTRLPDRAAGAWT